MFRRSKAEAPTQQAAAPTAPGAETGKGRPTPTRREAEAAARARAKASANPKGARNQARGKRMAESRVIREGIKAGDERYLTKRDRGPVRRFVRDFVDSRINFAEFSIPLLFASLIFSSAGAIGLGNGILNVTIILVFLDSLWLVFRLKRELRRRFPGQSYKGTTFYALTRALQLRFMRIPKAKVKLGQQLPQHYA